MPSKHFTYRIACSFEMQFTFDESEVEQSDEGGAGDLSPTDRVLEELGQEIQECLSAQFGGVDKIEVSADFDDMLGTTED
jgi:hypothetical protein